MFCDHSLSHSDVHSIYGETPMETDIAGHEGVGHVVKCELRAATALVLSVLF